MSKQLLKSGTLIGANLAEANGAISWAELSAKVSIPYKESQETKYWLWLLKETNYINDKALDSLFNDLNELAAILYIILRKTRFRKNAANNSLPPSTT